MQDNVTVSPLEAWSSAGVLTEMEETREGAGYDTEDGKERQEKQIRNEIKAVVYMFKCGEVREEEF